MTIRVNTGLPLVHLIRYPSVEDGTVAGLTHQARKLIRENKELRFDRTVLESAWVVSWASFFFGFTIARWW